LIICLIRLKARPTASVRLTIFLVLSVLLAGLISELF
jgi:hypothetical protein